MLRGSGSQECPNCAACKESVECVLIQCSSCDSQRIIFWDYLKEVLHLDTFEDFLCGSIFDKTAFYLGEKQGMLVKDECSSWYNRVSTF